jgi:glycosyltransferase involved in cell wall biosynthesis
VPSTGSNEKIIISVVLCTYNGEKFLKQQLESIAHQTMLPDELVICDDQSTDQTLEILKEFSARAPFFVDVVSNPKRLGYRENFMKAANLCRGQFIAFSDQDDVWLPQKLARCVEVLRRTGALMVAHGFDVVDENLNFMHRRAPSSDTVYDARGGDMWGFFHGFSQVFDRRLIDLYDSDRRPWDRWDGNQKLAHDFWIYFLSLSLGQTWLLSDSLALYRQHGKNLFGLGNPESGQLAHFWRVLASRDYRSQRVGLALARERERADGAGARAEVLREIGERASDPEIRRNARLSAEYWDRMADLCRSRSIFYAHDKLSARSVLFYNGLTSGLYSNGKGVGLREIPKDLILMLSSPPARAKSEQVEAG